jgi:hypothetical protein
MLLADGFERAMIGTAQVNGTTVAVYSADECLTLIMEEDGIDEDLALEWLTFNVIGAYVGDETPIFVWK